MSNDILKTLETALGEGKSRKTYTQQPFLKNEHVLAAASFRISTKKMSGALRSNVEPVKIWNNNGSTGYTESKTETETVHYLDLEVTFKKASSYISRETKQIVSVKKGETVLMTLKIQPKHTEMLLLLQKLAKANKGKIEGQTVQLEVTGNAGFERITPASGSIKSLAKKAEKL